jgi:arsenate reductase
MSAMNGDYEIKVLFVCIHNAARSRMAEAYLRKLGGPRFQVTSAGFEPHEANPLVAEAMRLAQVPLTTTMVQPSVFDLFRRGAMFNYVVSVCDEAQGQRCPIFAGVCRRLSWTFPDPSEFTGSEEEKLRVLPALYLSVPARHKCVISAPSAQVIDTPMRILYVASGGYPGRHPDLLPGGQPSWLATVASAINSGAISGHWRLARRLMRSTVSRRRSWLASSMDRKWRTPGRRNGGQSRKARSHTLRIRATS